MGYNSEREQPKDYSIKVLSQLAKQFQRRFLNIFPIESYAKTMLAILVGGQGHRIQFWKGATQGPFHLSLIPTGQAVSEEKTNIFLIGSYVKTMSADGGHLGWRAGHQIQFWKGTTQGPYQQSLVPIGQVVSEEKIFNYFFAEFSIFSHGSHLGWWVGSADIILKGDHQRTIPVKFRPN